MRYLLVLPMLVAACGGAPEVSSRRAALAASTTIVDFEGGGSLPACSEVDLSGVEEATVEDVGGGTLVVEVDGVAVCQGTEDEVEDALGHVVFDPDEGTPLPSITKGGDDPPPLPGTPLPSAF